VVDRTTIALRLADGWGIRRIALALGRSPGMVSDEVSRNRGEDAYEAGAAADKAAVKQTLSPGFPNRPAGALSGGRIFG
jgi:IS30 family transposase